MRLSPHLLLILFGVLWFVFWSRLSWVAWQADDGAERDVTDWIAWVIIGAFILIPAAGFILSGCGVSFQ